MAPEFPLCLSPSMLVVRCRRESGSGRDSAHVADDAPVRFGEGPNRIMNVPEPAWTDVVADLARTGAPLDENSVEEALDAMQEETLDSLYALLDNAGVDRGERLVIGLDGRGRLEVDEHPQRERVLALLDAQPRLAERLRHMAALALTGRGMRDIARAGALLAGEGAEDGRVFQACLKGGLSHFHLVRE